MFFIEGGLTEPAKVVAEDSDTPCLPLVEYIVIAGDVIRKTVHVNQYGLGVCSAPSPCVELVTFSTCYPAFGNPIVRASSSMVGGSHYRCEQSATEFWGEWCRGVVTYGARAAWAVMRLTNEGRDHVIMALACKGCRPSRTRIQYRSKYFILWK